MSTPLPLDDQLCFSLYAASMAVIRVYKPKLDQLGITYPQYLVLLALWDGDGLTIGAIAERLALESSNVTPMAKRLEAAGFVRRERNPKDERQVRVHLTARGWAVREECGCLRDALAAQSGFDEASFGTLNRQVKGLRDALETWPG